MEYFYILWIISIIVGIIIGHNKKQLVAGILLPIFLGWLGIIILLCLRNGNMKECPYCKKFIDQNATKCPYCQSGIIKNKLVD